MDNMLDIRQDLPFGKLNGYSVYQLNNKITGVYFLCIPDTEVSEYEMFISFPKKDLSNLSRKDIVNEIKDIADMIHSVKSNGIYAIPNINIDEVEKAANSSNKRDFVKLLPKIQAMTAEIYKRLTSGVDQKKSINQVINIIKQSESDIDFVEWLEANMPNFVHGITYDDLKNYYYGTVVGKDIPVDPLDADQIMIDENKENRDMIEDEDYEVNPEEKEKDEDSLEQEDEYSKEEEMDLDHTKENVKVRTLTRTPSIGGSYGFSIFPSLIFTLIVSAVAGIFIGFMLIK